MPDDPPRLSPLAAAMIAGLTNYLKQIKAARAEEFGDLPLTTIVVPYNLDHLEPDEYADLVAALNDLAWAGGGSGVERVGPRAFRILRD
jgi:hypothetical protein